MKIIEKIVRKCVIEEKNCDPCWKFRIMIRQLVGKPVAVVRFSKSRRNGAQILSPHKITFSS